MRNNPSNPVMITIAPPAVENRIDFRRRSAWHVRFEHWEYEEK
jgi:hypothetical protein